MTTPSKYQDFATSLLTDLRGSTDLIPRREVLVNWLEDFLLRAAKRGFQMGPMEVEDLIALDRFIRVNGIPATVRVALS